MITCGWVLHALQSSRSWDHISAYRVIFFAYAVIGLIKFALALALSKNVEAEKESPAAQDPETAPLLGDSAKKKKVKATVSLLPSISKESRVIIVNLCILFALDAFASGLAPL